MQVEMKDAVGNDTLRNDIAFHQPGKTPNFYTEFHFSTQVARGGASCCPQRAKIVSGRSFPRSLLLSCGLTKFIPTENPSQTLFFGVASTVCFL